MKSSRGHRDVAIAGSTVGKESVRPRGTRQRRKPVIADQETGLMKNDEVEKESAKDVEGAGSEADSVRSDGVKAES